MVGSAERFGEHGGIRAGGGDRCGRGAESIRVGLDVVGGGGRGAADKDSGKVKAGHWFGVLLRKVAGKPVG